MCNSLLSAPRLRNNFARGQIINRLCASLRDPDASRRFYFNEEVYCLLFGLNREERQAVEDRDFATLIEMGAHVGELDALAALSGLNTLEALRLRCGLRILE